MPGGPPDEYTQSVVPPRVGREATVIEQSITHLRLPPAVVAYWNDVFIVNAIESPLFRLMAEKSQYISMLPPGRGRNLFRLHRMRRPR